jgi:uncharacterized protein with ParB-like and HNH nuclease domain
MHANEAKVQTIIDSVRQYVIPLFQRPYSWEEKHWATLWQDLAELCEDEEPRNHFIGSIVTMPARSVPEGVTKFILIDGQQRLTTVLVLLAAIRDKAQHLPGTLADKVDDLYLKNRHQEGTDILKVLPTQVDREAFAAIMHGGERPPDNQVTRAYEFFEKRLRLHPEVDLDRLHNAIVRHLVLVSIVLDKDDNPYLIFESLNAKGRPLTQADLIRNFFFMRIHVSRQEHVYATHWKPMQDRLGENLTEFIRHFLMREGKVVKQSEVYYTLKEAIENKSPEEVIDYLGQVALFSTRYAKLLDPALERSARIASRMQRLNRFEVTTAYPFLLNVYAAYEAGTVTEAEFAELLDVLENFLIRRFICSIPTHGLHRTFSALYAQATRESGPFVENVKALLRERNYPRDAAFCERFITCKLYGGGERLAKTRLILERLEASFGHKEQTDPAGLSVEHVMPQTLTDWWKAHLGDDWEAIQETWLDTVGNLTLTAYNSELSNSDFPAKKAWFKTSHLEMNRHFAGVKGWDDERIIQRGEELAARALRIWPDFGSEDAPPAEVAPDEEAQEDVKVLVDRAIEQMGGEAESVGRGRFKHHRLKDGRLVNIKHSKKHGHPKGYYWFGIHHSLWEDMNKAGVTHLVLILAGHGFLTVPLPVVREYVANARVSKTTGGTVRHYHVHISTEPDLEFFHHGRTERFPLKGYYQKFAP